MRGFWPSVFAVAAIAITSGDVAAHQRLTPRQALVMLHSTTDMSLPQAAPLDVAPGETVTIAGECVNDESRDDLRVVLSMMDPAENEQAGYHAVLATVQTLADGTLRVEVPTLPEVRNHVFRVRLYVGEDDPSVCEAGTIRVS